MWRALGLTTGEPTVDGIAPALAASRLAVYDPDADRIYLSADASPEAAAADLRLALEQAYAAQHGAADDAAERYARRVDHRFPGCLAAAADRRPLRSTPTSPTRRDRRRRHDRRHRRRPRPPKPTRRQRFRSPIEYQLAAIDDLGEALLSSAGVDPTTARFGAPYPENVGAALDDGARPTASGALQVGDRSLAPTRSRSASTTGRWCGASRLPQSTVDQLASIVVADSFRPIDRAGLICVVAVFETANPTDAATVLAAMQTWAAASPAAAQSTVTQLADTRVQLSSCDPRRDRPAAATSTPSSTAS